MTYVMQKVWYIYPFSEEHKKQLYKAIAGEGHLQRTQFNTILVPNAQYALAMCYHMRSVR
jgi:hypothetical protein